MALIKATEYFSRRKEFNEEDKRRAEAERARRMDEDKLFEQLEKYPLLSPRTRRRISNPLVHKTADDIEQYLKK